MRSEKKAEKKRIVKRLRRYIALAFKQYALSLRIVMQSGAEDNTEIGSVSSDFSQKTLLLTLRAFCHKIIW